MSFLDDAVASSHYSPVDVELARWDTLQRAIAELRVEGHFSEAFRVATQFTQRTPTPILKEWERGDLERALKTLRHVLALSPAQREHVAKADRCLATAKSEEHAGRIVSAIGLAQQSLDLRRQLLGRTHVEVGEATVVLGTLKHAQANFVEARTLFEEAHAIYELTLEADHPRRSACTNDLGVIMRDLGDLEGALQVGDLALAARRQHGEKEKIAESANNLGVVLREKGEFAVAELLFREAAERYRESLGQESHELLTVLLNLASLSGDQGDYAESESLLREVLIIANDILGPHHPLVALAQHNLAYLLRQRGDHAGALSFLRKSLKVRKKTAGKHPDIAETLNVLALTYREIGRSERALRFFRLALSMYEELFGESHPDVAKLLNNRAIHHLGIGHLDEAEDDLLRALHLQSTTLTVDHFDRARTLAELGAVLIARGRLREAEERLREAAGIYERARLRVRVGANRVRFLRSPYLDLAATCLKLGKIEEAWSAVERQCGRVLGDMIRSGMTAPCTNSESHRGALLVRELTNRERELERTLLETPVGFERIAEARHHLFDAERTWLEFQRQLAVRDELLEEQVLPLSRIQEALEERDAIVGWLDVNQTGRRAGESWGYVIRESGPVTWSKVDLEERPTPRKVWRTVITDLCPAGAVAFELWSRRLEPLLPALIGAERVVVIASGDAMLGIPIEPLVDMGGSYAGDRWVVSYAPSASLLVWLTERAASFSGGRVSSALLIGDPSFTTEHAVPGSAPWRRGIEGHVMRSAVCGNRTTLARLPRLYGSRTEVQAVAANFDNATILLGSEASEAALQDLVDSGSMDHFDVIHIATHALVDGEDPGRSALILSQLDLSDSTAAGRVGSRFYTGVLRARDILREWHLGASLVTLSACETGLGTELRGEGYVGLAHAFLKAGAQSVLVSLWQVEDSATALLMRRFYEIWTGSSKRTSAGGQPTKAEALQQAKAWLREQTDSKGRRPYAHPYYWSGFILFGARD